LTEVLAPAELLALLERLGIAYERCDHPAVFTAAEAERLVPPLPGAKAKNLFLRSTPQRWLLVVVPYGKRVDLPGLAAGLGERRLAFASPEELATCLRVVPGAVSLLALVHDTAGCVNVVIDEAVWQADGLQCHPLANTTTVSLAKDGVRRFLAATGHVPRVLDVPSRGS
jgi:Ala-tRNA(Pro) deacylase